MSAITIREKATGRVLARGEEGGDAIRYEGNWYFRPEAVERDVLTTTDRTYTCPAKGTCNWVDFSGPDGASARDVAWIYPDTKPGHEPIRGRYGFSAGSRGATLQDGGTEIPGGR